MRKFGHKIARAASFIEAATIVCDEVRRLGVFQCGVFLHQGNGPPTLVVDNYCGISDEHRLVVGLGEDNWKHNPGFNAIREQLRPSALEGLDNLAFNTLIRQKGYTGCDFYPYASPVIGPHGWFATTLHASAEPYTPSLERALAMIATHLSVWCTQHGIDALRDPPICESVKLREHQIAYLAAGGQTNLEIAESMGISINTVKKHLKQVFEKVGVKNRTELVGALRNVAAPIDLPIGITHLRTVTVTRRA